MLNQIPKITSKGLNSQLVKSEVINVLKSLYPKTKRAPSEVVEDAMRLKSGNSYIKYHISLTEYMREPLDLLDSYEVTDIIFMGPARTGKSEALVKGSIVYSIIHSHADTLLVHLNMEKAQEYSEKELIPIFNNSPKILEWKSPEPRHNKIKSMRFKGQNTLLIRHPSKNVLAATTVQYVILTDYDRWPLNVDGEGDGYTLARKRTTTFGLAAKVVVESSPGHVVVNPSEKITNEHIAPQSSGIASLYNSGDRRCYYFQCRECREWYVAKWQIIKWEEDPNLSIPERANSARIECPHCKARFKDSERLHLIRTGRWLKDGETIDKDGNITSNNPKEEIGKKPATFWLRAPACAFNRLYDLVHDYLVAFEDYVRSGQEFKLQTFFNTSVGEPYIPQAYKLENSVSKDLKLPEHNFGEAPANSICLIATVDVQSGEFGRFVVQVHALTTEQKLYVVDRYEIITDSQGRRIHPDREAQDWHVLEEYVFKYQAKIKGYEDLFLNVSAVLIDSGGMDQTTNNAYLFYQHMKRKIVKELPEQIAPHFFLLKGEATRAQTRDYLAYFKSYTRDQKRNKNQPSRLFWVNSTNCKLWLSTLLQRKPEQKNSIIFPHDTPDSIFDELESEVLQNGLFVKKSSSVRNETIDLLVYCLAYIHAVVDEKAFIKGALESTYNVDSSTNLPRFLTYEMGNPFFTKRATVSKELALAQENRNQMLRNLDEFRVARKQLKRKTLKITRNKLQQSKTDYKLKGLFE